MSRTMGWATVGRRLTARQRMATLTVVLLAQGLSHLPPRRLAAVLKAARKGARPAGYQEAAAARHAVVTSSRRCSGDEGCLTRSIATTLLCRMHGAWPTWRIGVMTTPLTAHAWVEANARVVAEPKGVEQYRVLMSVGPIPADPGPAAVPRTTNP